MVQTDSALSNTLANLTPKDKLDQVISKFVHKQIRNALETNDDGILPYACSETF
jgi:hypothetical protein